MPKDAPPNGDALPDDDIAGELPVGPRRRVSEMQAKLHRWAAADPGRRFDDLFNLVHDPATLIVAWDRVATNRGANTAGAFGPCPQDSRTVRRLRPRSRRSKARVSRPGAEQRLTRDAACGKTQQPHNRDDFIERPDHGRNSGSRSMGEITQKMATTRATAARRGTSGSLRNVRAAVTHAGRNWASWRRRPGAAGGLAAP